MKLWKIHPKSTTKYIHIKVLILPPPPPPRNHQKTIGFQGELEVINLIKFPLIWEAKYCKFPYRIAISWQTTPRIFSTKDSWWLMKVLQAISHEITAYWNRIARQYLKLSRFRETNIRKKCSTRTWTFPMYTFVKR